MTKYTTTALKEMLEKKLSHNFGVTPEQASDDIFYKACVLVILDIMSERKASFKKSVDEQGAKTIYYSILMPVIMGMFERIFPGFQSITQDPLLDVICYILVVGVGLSILFSRNASSGGLDIVAKIMNKYLRMDLGKAMSYSGIAVALSTALCYDSKTIVLSLLGTYFGGMVVDNFIFGINIKRRVCVISEHLDEIVHFVIHDLHSGATLNEIIGGYDRTPRMEMVTIVDKHEYRLLMDFLHKVDPKAFVTVYSVSDMRYQPKTK